MTDWRRIGAFLLRGADPLFASGRLPAGRLSPAEALLLIGQAEGHGVLPALMRNLAPLFDDPALAEAAAEGRRRLRTARAHTLMLREAQEALAPALDGLAATVVKGPVFAARLYPEPALRLFTDIDILAAPAALGPLAASLAELGFSPDDGDAAERREWKWIDRAVPLRMVEVQTDLIHAPSLRRKANFGYGELGDQPESVAACLAVALVHGAYSHGFERLQQVVDVCQGARLLGTPDEQAFLDRLGSPPLRRAAAAGLDLTARLFDVPRAAAIADALGRPSSVRAAARLLDRSVVLSARTPWRSLHAWRRQLFREWLKRA